MKKLVISVLLMLLSFFTHASDAKPVSIAIVKSERVSPTIQVLGKVRSKLDSSLSMGVSGKLEWIIDTGTEVERGQTLAQLDSKPYDIKIMALTARQKRVELELAALQREYARLETLSKNSVSEQELDDLMVKIQLARADKELLSMELILAKENKNKTKLTAPFAGVVVSRTMQVGEDVTSTQAVLRLVNKEKMEILAHGPLVYRDYAINATSIQVLHEDGEVKLPVTAILPATEANKLSFSLLLDIPSQLTSSFYIGQLLSVSLPVANTIESLMVPRDALVLSNNNAKVFVLNDENTVKAIPVKLHQGFGSYIKVEGELQAGQRVVIRGADFLKSGQQVKVLSDHTYQVQTLSE